MPHLTKSAYASIQTTQFDAIVIGSGMGGLTAAAILAKGGRERVLLLERHTTLGGCTHEFAERGVEFDTGLHYVGGKVWEPNSQSRRVFDYITDNRVEWTRMDEAYDVVIIDKKRFPIRAGVENFRADLESWFPASKAAIANYLTDVQATASKYQFFIFNQVASGWVPKSWIRVDPSFGDELVSAALTRLGVVEKGLREVLTYLHGDYGAEPNECSWVQHCVTVSHYLEGAAYPVGGPARIAQAVAPVIESRGGRCLTMASVTRILVEGGKAVGVELKGHGPVRGNKIISAVGAYNTIVDLLPEQTLIPELTRARKALTSGELPSSVAHAMVFVALDGSQKDLGLPAANIWINKTAPDSQEFASAFISFPSCKDPEWQVRHPNTTVCEVVVEANFDDFERWVKEPIKGRSGDYEDTKARIAERMLAVLFEHFPQLKDKVQFYEASTPLSSQHYLGSRKGTSYGLKCVPARFRATADWLKPATALPGLYLTGQDVLSCGIVGAMMGGVMTASASSTLGALAVLPLMR